MIPDMNREDLEKAASLLAASVAKKLSAAAKEGGTEADFRGKAAVIFAEAGKKADIHLVHKDEYVVAHGRADSVYNRLILEYKRPGVLKQSVGAKANVDAINQVQTYIEDIAEHQRSEVKRLAGVVTDGIYMIFTRRVGDGWSDLELHEVNSSSVEKYLRLLFALSSGAALIPENLLEDFGPGKTQTQRAVRAIYHTLLETNNKLVRKLFDQWKAFYSEATDYEKWAQKIERKKEFRAFIVDMGLRPEEAEAAPVFFAIHTYFALLVKLIAAMAAARFAGNIAEPLKELSGKEGEDLRNALNYLERGGALREWGLRNFLEGDFFRWYLYAWNDDLEIQLRNMIVRLSEYDPTTLEIAPENARDLLKKLYHGLMPREIRHDLGEYYTPDWLAERLILQTLGQVDLGNAKKRVLDPACGSGTFLVLLIKHIRARAARNKRDPKETLSNILSNVIGIDLNPLAVIAARTNYLLALGDLIKNRDGDIDIPVYQADSVLTPSRGNNLDSLGTYPLETAVGVFKIPESFATLERMDILANHLEDAVEDGRSDTAFYKHLKDNADLDIEELEASEVCLRELYKQMQELHKEGINGVWTRILKNQFAPRWIEREPCDYIVGNPPWVNWDHLPGKYRKKSIPLWKHYGLFPHTGMDAILGKGKKDFSALMTYVAGDKYLKQGGKLGFIITQSLLKTSGAGQGFRRFELPGKVPFSPLSVDDMSSFQPFEKTNNRTAVIVLVKGKPLSYPIGYNYWKKRLRGRGSSVGFDTPYKEVTTDKITYATWVAEPVDPNDITSTWITARRSAIRAMRKGLGSSPYQAHAGAYSGGCNPVYWVSVTGKRPDGLLLVQNITEGQHTSVRSTTHCIEGGLLYPLVRSGDLSKWVAKSDFKIILAQDTKTKRGIEINVMQSKYPRTYSYFKQYENILLSRKDRGTSGIIEQGGAFYSMFGIGEYTVSNHKACWSRMGKVEAAVLHTINGRSMIPQETLVLVECHSAEEANYIVAVINSSVFQCTVSSFGQKGGKSMGSPSILEYIQVPRYDPGNPVHVRLTMLSQEAHKAATQADSNTLEETENKVNKSVAELWDLSDKELKEIQRTLEEL